MCTGTYVRAMVRRWREGEEREKKMMWKVVEPKEGAFRLELSGNTVEWTVKAGFSRKRMGGKCPIDEAELNASQMYFSLVKCDEGC